MNTISTQMPRRYRTLAATLLTAAATGTIAVGGLGSAAPAEAAADQWVAIAYSPVDKQYGIRTIAPRSRR